MAKLLTEESKLPFHTDRVCQWLEGEPVAPITVDLALHPGCNYKCEYCYGQMQRQPDAKPWTWDMIRWTLDDFREIGVKAVSFVSDGESTLNKHFWDAVRFAKKNGLDVGVGTHGAQLDSEGLESNLRYLTYLRFNISAADIEAYTRIHGCSEKAYYRVLENIREARRVKADNCLSTTIGLQMVFLPTYGQHVIPLCYLGKGLGVDYLQIKHCSDDESGTLGVPYDHYELCDELLRRAERVSDSMFDVVVKWEKIKTGNKRSYKRCLGPPFQLQISGSGRVAPCGMFFHGKYFRYHIGNLHETRFKKLWLSDRYWQVMDHLRHNFNAQVACGCLCLQHAANSWLDKLLDKKVTLERPKKIPGHPDHINFI